jgi:uncharacterized DUF497 family protein
MRVRITEKTEWKIREKHGLVWDDVATIFEDDAGRVDYRYGETDISFGATRSGATVTVITVRKGGVLWVKTARPMTDAEKRLFRKKKR